jgi:hypothetical protein
MGAPVSSSTTRESMGSALSGNNPYAQPPMQAMANRANESFSSAPFHPPAAGWVAVKASRCPGRVVRQAMNAAQTSNSEASRNGAPGMPQTA